MYRKRTKADQRIFSPELLPNSEQKAENISVSPAIANANVACCRHS
jgi:hypothetical protein